MLHNNDSLMVPALKIALLFDIAYPKLRLNSKLKCNRAIIK